MGMFKCSFEKDVAGIYILPLLGYSNVHGVRAIWAGWLWWLFMITFPDKKENTL